MSAISNYIYLTIMIIPANDRPLQRRFAPSLIEPPPAPTLHRMTLYPNAVDVALKYHVKHIWLSWIVQGLWLSPSSTELLENSQFLCSYV